MAHHVTAKQLLKKLGSSQSEVDKIEKIYMKELRDYTKLADWVEENISITENDLDDVACPDDEAWPPPTSTADLQKVLEKKEATDAETVLA